MSEMKPVEATCSELVRLINRELYPDQWLFESDGEWWCTSEWLVGTFGGRAFVGDTKDGAVNKLIDYLNRHIGHDNMVGMVVRESGWPNLKSVEDYIRVAWSADLSDEENGEMNHE